MNDNIPLLNENHVTVTLTIPQQRRLLDYVSKDLKKSRRQLKECRTNDTGNILAHISDLTTLKSALKK